MDGNGQYSRPLVVSGPGDDAPARPLTRVQVGRHPDGAYSEAWLQRLIHRNPHVLPIDQIEPALIPLIPVCIELPTPSGYVDNLLVTPDGDLVLVECKLWRNHEARREVVGQILDYAKDLASWDYEDLEGAIRKAGRPDLRLHDLVADAIADAEVDEAGFVDAVSRNLKRGRFLLLIVGDGVREGTERLADFLQQHAGLHFTFALVELAIFALPPDAGYLVQPRIPARTVNIERAIVTIGADGNVALAPAPQRGRAPGRRTTISEEKFFEDLGAENPGLPERLRAFLDEIEPLGIQPAFGQDSLILRWQPDEMHKFNLGTIETNGDVSTRPVNWVSDYIGRLDLSHRYLSRVASLVEGGFVKQTAKPTGWYAVAGSGRPAQLPALLERRHEWRAAMEEFVTAAAAALKH